MVTINLSTNLYNCLIQPFKGLRTKRCHPIGTNHCIVLRDEHIHTKPEMTGYTTKQVAISIRNENQIQKNLGNSILVKLFDKS